MSFTQTGLFMLTTTCLLMSCKNKKYVGPVMAPVKTLMMDSTFRFSENEEKLFQRGDVPLVLNLDTVYSIDQLRHFAKTVPYEKKVARAFTYCDGSSIPKVFHIVGEKERSHPAGLNMRVMIIYIDSATIISYGGYEVAQHDPDPAKLDRVASVFFEQSFASDAARNKEASNYRTPYVLLSYYDDDIRSATNFCSAIARGYILFQRKNSLKIFNKSIDSLNNQELRQLAATAPLTIGISREEIKGH
jgi:hypothetical protein